MKYAVNIPSLNIDYEILPSKSVVHRQLIVSFLSQTLSEKPDESIISKIFEPGDNDNDDIKATKACLKALYEADKTTDVFMPCKESGSTLRFMISVGAAYLSYKGFSKTKRLIFLPEGRLIDRPLDQLAECLKARGVTVETDKNDKKIIVYGTLSKGTFEIQGNISSQYVSGLLMALILLPEYSVHLEGPLESKGYFELTINTLKKNGFTVIEKDGLYTIAHNKQAKASNIIKAEGDWSSAAFLLCLGALSENATIKLSGLDKESSQKDRVVTEILEMLGIHTEWHDGCIRLFPQTTKASDSLELDASDYPDIVPYIAVLAAAFTKSATIKNIERLRYKECDRVDATIKTLEAAGVSASEDNGILTINGAEKSITTSDSIDIQTYSDHRIAMMACLVAAWTKKTVYIDNKECVNKSFPRLFELIEKSKSA